LVGWGPGGAVQARWGGAGPVRACAWWGGAGLVGWLRRLVERCRPGGAVRA